MVSENNETNLRLSAVKIIQMASCLELIEQKTGKNIDFNKELKETIRWSNNGSIQ